MMLTRLIVFCLAALLWINLFHDAASLALTEGPGFKFRICLLFLCTALLMVILAWVFADVPYRALFDSVFWTRS